MLRSAFVGIAAGVACVACAVGGFFVGHAKSDAQAELEASRWSALLAPEPENTGRYQIVTNNLATKNFYLLDTATGDSWEIMLSEVGDREDQHVWTKIARTEDPGVFKTNRPFVPGESK